MSVDLPDLAAFFGRHDLQIGAGGGATWERCRAGAPSILVVLAANQQLVVRALSRDGIVRAASMDGVAWPALRDVVAALLQDAPGRGALSRAGAALVDGHGARRVALAVMAGALAVRAASLADGPLLHGWRNHPSVRLASFNQAAIALADHMRWLEGVLASGERWLFIATVGTVPVGSIRFDRIAAATVEVSLSVDPDLQGLGLGVQLLRRGEEALLARGGGGWRIEAQVLPGNAASCRLFEACGYDGGPQSYCKTIGAAQPLRTPAADEHS